MLRLAESTAPAWVDHALAHLDEVLLDHTHCEKKAAGAAIKLLFSYPQHRFLQEPLARLAREELVHFEQMLGQLERRGVAFERQRPSAYGGRLHALVRPREPDRLLDWLLVCGLIEARSCERLGMLAEAIEDEPLAALYRGLLEAEARHHAAYWELATKLAAPELVRDRMLELARHEAVIVHEASPLARLHTGLPAPGAPRGGNA